jgi:methionyl-tRNA formyltransferase
LKVKIVECPEKKPAGMIFEKVKNTGFIVAVGKGAIQVEIIQPAGKKIMTASVFDLGARITIGEQLS